MSIYVYKISTLTINNVEWTPVVTPGACNSMSVKNDSGGSILISTNPEDPGAQDDIPAGAQEVLLASRQEFPAGQVLFYLKSVSGTNSIKLRFLW